MPLLIWLWVKVRNYHDRVVRNGLGEDSHADATTSEGYKNGSAQATESVLKDIPVSGVLIFSGFRYKHHLDDFLRHVKKYAGWRDDFDVRCTFKRKAEA